MQAHSSCFQALPAKPGDPGEWSARACCLLPLLSLPSKAIWLRATETMTNGGKPVRPTVKEKAITANRTGSASQEGKRRGKKPQCPAATHCTRGPTEVHTKGSGEEIENSAKSLSSLPPGYLHHHICLRGKRTFYYPHYSESKIHAGDLTQRSNLLQAVKVKCF